MHGAGNDFVLIDNREQEFEPTMTLIQSLGNRHTGIGFDQLLLIQKSNNSLADAAYRFFNPDGSEAEQCGNGQRCITHYLFNHTKDQSSFCVSGLAGLIYSHVNKDSTVSVNMGTINSINPTVISENNFYEVDFGNPHLVYIIKDIETVNLSKLNDTYTKDYQNGINFEIVEIVNLSLIHI